MLLHKVFWCTINNSWNLKGTMHEREHVIQKHLPIVIFGLFLPGLDTYIISVHPLHSEHLLNLEVKGVALMRYQVIICLNVKLELALLATHKCLNLLHDDLSH